VASEARRCRFGPLEVAYDERVLEPRPWTLAQSRWAAEMAIDAAPGPLLELCAGVGHIGLAAAVLADRDLVQVELDPVAGAFARANAKDAGWVSRVEVRVGRLEDVVGAGERFPLIIADPPYLPTAEVDSFPQDPVLAIDGGGDGLALIRACLVVASGSLLAGGPLLLQLAGARQADQVSTLVAAGEPAALQVLETRVIDHARAIMLLASSGGER